MRAQTVSQAAKTDRLLMLGTLGLYLVGGSLVGGFSGRWFDVSIVMLNALLVFMVLTILAPAER